MGKETHHILPASWLQASGHPDALKTFRKPEDHHLLGGYMDVRCPLSHALFSSVQSYHLDRDGLKWADLDGDKKKKN